MYSTEKIQECINLHNQQPQLPKKALAHRLGISIGLVKNILSGRRKVVNVRHKEASGQGLELSRFLNIFEGDEVKKCSICGIKSYAPCYACIIRERNFVGKDTNDILELELSEEEMKKVKKFCKMKQEIGEEAGSPRIIYAGNNTCA